MKKFEILDDHGVLSDGWWDIMDMPLKIVQQSDAIKLASAKYGIKAKTAALAYRVLAHVQTTKNIIAKD